MEVFNLIDLTVVDPEKSSIPKILFTTEKGRL